MEEENYKGYKVKDKRRIGKEEGGKDRNDAGESRDWKEADGDKRKWGHHDDSSSIDFTTFIMSLSTSSLIHLGEIDDPQTKKAEQNLPAARQTIDLIALLKEKTKGNLSPEEEGFLENILFDLRIRFVKIMK